MTINPNGVVAFPRLAAILNFRKAWGLSQPVSAFAAETFRAVESMPERALPLFTVKPVARGNLQAHICG
jgi:hypothetical protein